MTFQEVRDAIFKELIDLMAAKYHSRNIRANDTYANYETEQQAFFDMERKFLRAKRQLQLPPEERDWGSFVDAIEDLGIYAVMFRMYERANNELWKKGEEEQTKYP